MTAALRAVDIPTMIDVNNRDRAGGVVDTVDDPIGAAPGAEPVVQRGKQLLAYPVRFADQRSGHELVCRDRDCLRQALAESLVANCFTRPVDLVLVGPCGLRPIVGEGAPRWSGAPTAAS
jgi:hypothetical protein